MSVNLCCPNCGSVVGYADHSDGYKEKYLKSDNSGNPECPNCGAGESMVNFERNLFIGVVILIILIPLILIPCL